MVIGTCMLCTAVAMVTLWETGFFFFLCVSVSVSVCLSVCMSVCVYVCVWVRHVELGKIAVIWIVPEYSMGVVEGCGRLWVFSMMCEGKCVITWMIRAFTITICKTVWKIVFFSKMINFKRIILVKRCGKSCFSTKWSILSGSFLRDARQFQCYPLSSLVDMMIDCLFT